MGSAAKTFFIVSIALVILYVLLKKSSIYVDIFAGIVKVFSKGVNLLTTGKLQ